MMSAMIGVRTRYYRKHRGGAHNPDLGRFLGRSGS